MSSLNPPLVLFCKSYIGDLKRVQTLLDSIGRFNRERITTYLSVPRIDLSVFQEALVFDASEVNLIEDEEILLSNPGHSLKYFSNWDGRITQQVVKSEFWRYWLKQNPNQNELVYVCLDSESEFKRDFYINDFISESGTPYTICHDNSDLLNLAKSKGKTKVLFNFQKDCAMIKEVFFRSGPDYAFSPTPVIWSSKVWQDLNQHYLIPRGLTFGDMIRQRPNELHWYGEALLNFKSIPLEPRGPLFRVYHYDWEFFSRINAGETHEIIIQKFLGILKQSNWDFEKDIEGKRTRVSKLGRRVKRLINRFLYSFVK